MRVCVSVFVRVCLCVRVSVRMNVRLGEYVCFCECVFGFL
jgi:hypothetical protein